MINILKLIQHSPAVMVSGVLRFILFVAREGNFTDISIEITKIFVVGISIEHSESILTTF
jgi:hypothetical protein